MRFSTLIAMAALAAPLPALASPVANPIRPAVRRPAPIFTALELNNLARLDETTAPARLRQMQTEIAGLRDEVGRMELTHLIDTVLTTPAKHGTRASH